MDTYTPEQTTELENDFMIEWNEEFDSIIEGFLNDKETDEDEVEYDEDGEVLYIWF